MLKLLLRLLPLIFGYHEQGAVPARVARRHSAFIHYRGKRSLHG